LDGGRSKHNKGKEGGGKSPSTTHKRPYRNSAETKIRIKDKNKRGRKRVQGREKPKGEQH